MPAPSPQIARDTIARARHDYATGKPVSVILAEHKLSKGIFYRIIDGVYGADAMPALQRRYGAGASRGRVGLIARLWVTAERQVREIEKRLRIGGQEPTERERDARVLAITVKTLRELRALDAAQAEQEPSPEDEQGPDNLDDFRRELARKMDAIIEARKAPGAGGGEC
jgi:hypothetical protein